MRWIITVLTVLVLVSCLLPSAAAIEVGEHLEVLDCGFTLELGVDSQEFFAARSRNELLSMGFTLEYDGHYWLWFNNDGQIEIKGPYLGYLQVEINVHPVGWVYLMVPDSQVKMPGLSPVDFESRLIYNGPEYYRQLVSELEYGEGPVVCIRINRDGDQIETWRRHEFAVNTQIYLSMGLNVDFSQVRIEYVEDDEDNFDITLILPTEYQGLPVVNKWSTDIGRLATGKLDLESWKMRLMYKSIMPSS